MGPWAEVVGPMISVAISLLWGPGGPIGITAYLVLVGIGVLVAGWAGMLMALRFALVFALIGGSSVDTWGTEGMSGGPIATLDFLSCHALAAEILLGGWQSGPRSPITVSNGAPGGSSRPGPERNNHSSARARAGYQRSDRRITRANKDERHRPSAERPPPRDRGDRREGQSAIRSRKKCSPRVRG